MDGPAAERPVFKKCPMCGFSWESRGRFLADPCVEVIGYQSCLTNLGGGCFLFNHSCDGTFAVRVDQFVDLYRGPVYEKRMTGSQECPGYCLHRDELRPCPTHCECAFVREILQLVRRWPKNPGRLHPAAT